MLSVRSWIAVEHNSFAAGRRQDHRGMKSRVEEVYRPETAHPDKPWLVFFNAFDRSLQLRRWRLQKANAQDKLNFTLPEMRRHKIDFNKYHVLCIGKHLSYESEVNFIDKSCMLFFRVIET